MDTDVTQDGQDGINNKDTTKSIPGYLKYVAKKYKAGFGKVHEELYKFFSGSATDKSQEKPTDHSFVSYIPEDDQDLEQNSSSFGDFDILSEETDLIKHENSVLHSNGKFVEKNKNKLNLSNRYSMPHLDLTDEAIYINDRVLKTETFTKVLKTIEGNENEDISEIYSIPIRKDKSQSYYEINDYVNLRAPYQPFKDTITSHTMTGQMLIKDNAVSECMNDCDKNTEKKDTKTHKTSQPLVKVQTEKQVENVNDDDNYYLPPSQWLQSCPPAPLSHQAQSYAPVADSYIYAKVEKKKTPAGVSKIVTPLKDDNTDTEENYYVPPIKWVT